MNFGHIKKIHFVGIGGIGMSGIAEILSAYELSISGCDLKASSTTDRLSHLGIPIFFGHDPAHVAGMDLIVMSSAVRQDNPEVESAREQQIPVTRRAEILGEITRLKRAVAVAGTHGKTTTSAMTALILAEAGLDPTLIIGGMLHDFDGNARLGKSELMVVEADEYDRSFLTLYPFCAVITNIEADHLDCYRDLDDIRGAFAQFASLVSSEGVIIGCSDDENVVALIEQSGKRAVRYGLSSNASLRAISIAFDEDGATFDVELERKRLGRITLRVPGLHNVRNALAAIAVALELGVRFQVAAAALERFSGVERRFQILGEFQGAIVVDDYAHHPTEVRATLQAARSSYPSRRLIALFQPHLFTRTRDFYEAFADALAIADMAYVMAIFPAREEPIAGVTSNLITDAAAERGAGHVSLVDNNVPSLVELFRPILGSDDLFITLGAGDVHLVAEALVKAA